MAYPPIACFTGATALSPNSTPSLPPRFAMPILAFARVRDSEKERQWPFVKPRWTIVWHHLIGTVYQAMQVLILHPAKYGHFENLKVQITMSLQSVSAV